MGWALGFDENHQRFVGYGVPAYCDHPDCKEEITRGLHAVCGGEPYGGEDGCGLHFCSSHLYYPGHLCERCDNGDDSFEKKIEHSDWIDHVLSDDSWAEWRSENKEVLLHWFTYPMDLLQRFLEQRTGK